MWIQKENDTRVQTSGITFRVDNLETAIVAAAAASSPSAGPLLREAREVAADSARAAQQGNHKVAAYLKGTALNLRSRAFGHNPERR